MYSIRLELGRELEDLLFRRMQAKEEEEERAAQEYRQKKSWLLRKIGKLSIHLGFLAGILIFAFADHSSYEKLKALGWHVVIIWECAIRHGDADKALKKLIDEVLDDDIAETEPGSNSLKETLI